MDLPQIEVYAVAELGERSLTGFYKEDGRKVVLKPKLYFSNLQVIEYLFNIKMYGIPYVLGETTHSDKEYIVFSWVDGEAITTANLDDQGKVQAVLDVLDLIDKLQTITGLNWFFVDMKPQHIVIGKDASVGLIDFEHVIVSRFERVLWRDYKQIGISQTYCSPEIRGDYLSKNHHEYALAIILLSLISNRSPEELKSGNYKRILHRISKYTSLNLESALAGKGLTSLEESEVKSEKKDDFIEKDVTEHSNNRKNESNINRELPNILVLNNDISADESWFISLDERNLHNNIENLNLNLSEAHEVQVLRNIRFVLLCSCHHFPIISSLDFAYMKKEGSNNLRSEILQAIQNFSQREQEPNLLTKNLAKHIVKQYNLSDLFLSNKFFCLCKFTSCRDLSINWQKQEVRFGNFAYNSVISQKISDLR